MAYTFDKSLETGNPAIDSQHRELIDATNRLLSACSVGKGRTEIETTLKFLSDYVVKHFGDEEALQLKYKYPDYQVHKKLHEEFKATVRKIVAEYEETGATITLVSKVNSAVGGWLITHIKTIDKKLAEYIRSVTN